MENTTIQATVFHKPKGRKELIALSNIYLEDAEYINSNNIKVSLESAVESTVGGYVIYFDYGKITEDGEPDEHLEMSLGKSCEDTIKSAVEKLKRKI